MYNMFIHLKIKIVYNYAEVWTWAQVGTENSASSFSSLYRPCFDVTFMSFSWYSCSHERGEGLSQNPTWNIQRTEKLIKLKLIQRNSIANRQSTCVFVCVTANCAMRDDVLFYELLVVFSWNKSDNNCYKPVSRVATPSK